MAKEIENENGETIIVYTAEEKQAEIDAEKARLQAEYDAKLREKDEHFAEKSKQFEQGKFAKEREAEEAKRKAEEAIATANEAKSLAESEKQNRFDTLKKFTFKQYVGEDPELTKKLEDAYALVNKEVTSEADISERVRLAYNMAGLNAVRAPGAGGFSGGYVPDFSPASKANADADYDQFKEAVGADEIFKSAKQ